MTDFLKNLPIFSNMSFKFGGKFKRGRNVLHKLYFLRKSLLWFYGKKIIVNNKNSIIFTIIFSYFFSSKYEQYYYVGYVCPSLVYYYFILSNVFYYIFGISFSTIIQQLVTFYTKNCLKIFSMVGNCFRLINSLLGNLIIVNNFD